MCEFVYWWGPGQEGVVTGGGFVVGDGEAPRNVGRDLDVLAGGGCGGVGGGKGGVVGADNGECPVQP